MSKSFQDLNFFENHILTDLLLINRSVVWEIYVFSYWWIFFFIKWRVIGKAGVFNSKIAWNISKKPGLFTQIYHKIGGLWQYCLKKSCSNDEYNSAYEQREMLSDLSLDLWFELRLRRYYPLWALKHYRSLTFFNVSDLMSSWICIKTERQDWLLWYLSVDDEFTWNSSLIKRNFDDIFVKKIALVFVVESRSLIRINYDQFQLYLTA